MCFGMKCPYEFPSGECSIQGGVPEDAECKGGVDDDIQNSKS